MEMAPGAGPSWWDVRGEWAEPPNERRNGTSGVQRVVDPQSGATYFVKRPVNHLYRSLRHPSGRPTLLREWRNLQRCAKLGVPTAVPLFFDMRVGAAGWEAVLVTQALEGYASLEQGLREGRWSAPRRQQILLKVAEAIAPLHLAGRKHGHLYPKEIFVRDGASVAVAFLDWEVARWVGLPRWAAQSDLARLWRSLAELGVGDDDRRAFFSHYRSLTGLSNLRLRGVAAEPAAA